MFLRHSHESESALNFAGSNYQKADIDLKIQEYLKAYSPGPSVEEIATFIIATEIGMFIVVCIVILTSHQSFQLHLSLWQCKEKVISSEDSEDPKVYLEKCHKEEWVQCCVVWKICVVEPACVYDTQFCYPKLVSVLWLTMYKALSQVIGVSFFYYLSSIESLSSSSYHTVGTPRLAKNEPSAIPTSVFIPGSAPSNRVNSVATCTRTSPA